jgi:AhpC/TSA family.
MIMMKRLFAATLIGLITVLVLQATGTKKKIENFTLSDYNSVQHSLTDYKSSKAIVLMFIATQCPVSNAYNERMVQLCKDYTSKGVAFIGINSNKQEGADEIKEHAQDHGFVFPILKDNNNTIADKLGASVTPEIFVLNSKFEILYHGRIDDSKKEAKVSSKDLRTALDEILTGKPLEINETKAFGCSIKRVE